MIFKNKIVRFKLLLVLFIGVIVLSGFSYFLISNSHRSKAQFIECVQGTKCVNNAQCGNTGYCNIFNPPSVSIAGNNKTNIANPPISIVGSCMCGGVATPPIKLTPAPISEIQCDTATCKGGWCTCNQFSKLIYNQDQAAQNQTVATVPINCSKLTCNGVSCLCTPNLPTPTQTPPTAVCQSLVNSLSDVAPLKISTGGISLNWGGLQEKWLQDKNNAWYYAYPYPATDKSVSSIAVMKWDQNKGLKANGKNTGADVMKTPETKACYDAINVGYTFPKPNGTITPPPQPTPIVCGSQKCNPGYVCQNATKTCPAGMNCATFLPEPGCVKLCGNEVCKSGYECYEPPINQQPPCKTGEVCTRYPQELPSCKPITKPTPIVQSDGLTPCVFNSKEDINPKVATVCFTDKGDAKRTPSSTDWIGIYKSGPDGKAANEKYVAWKYLTNTQSPGIVQSGRVTFENLPPGQYEARFFLSNGYQKVNAISVTVSSIIQTSTNKLTR